MITPRPARVLVVLPSWVGDTTMATPALRALRQRLPRAVVVALGRPGMDELLAGEWPQPPGELLDDVMIADSRSLLGPAKAAARIRPQRADACLLLPNSFSSAMTARLAGIPVRVGYDRDGRGLLLTHGLEAPRRSPPAWATAGWEPISAVEYYLRAAHRLCDVLAESGFIANGAAPVGAALMHGTALELALTPAQDRAAASILRAGGLDEGEPFALVNPGGNNPAKRWPVERFAAVVHHLITAHRLRVVLNGSPAEAALVALIRDAVALNHPDDATRVACLPELGITLGSLKGVVKRARLLITNDTGPRHLAAAFGTPAVSLFGPTDPRWTSLPDADRGVGVPDAGTQRPRARERVIVADPTLPLSEVTDEHPERCRMDRITASTVLKAVDEMLAPGASAGAGAGAGGIGGVG